MGKFVVTECCMCGRSFRVVGEGEVFTCPYCDAELSFNSKYASPDMYGRYGDSEPELDEPLYYDEDLEGVPGFYGGD